MRVEWVNSQNPLRTFTSKHSLLPGQEYSDFGILQKFTGIFDEFCRFKTKGWNSRDPGTLPHRCVLFKKVFLFIDSVLEGRFRAMRRDLKGLTIADVSKAVDQGRLFNIT